MFIGIGGLISNIVGGYLTQYYHPRLSLGIFSISGLTMCLFGIFLSADCEYQENEEEDDFVGQLQSNMSKIWYALWLPEIYRVLGFYFFNGLLSPSFGQFTYYFMLNECGISQMQYSMLNVVTKAF